MENSQTINAESLPNSVPDRLVPETIPNNAKPNNANKAMFVCDNCGTEYKYITFLQVHQKRKRCESIPPLRKLSSDQVPGRSNSIPVPVVIIPSSPIMGRPEEICLSENCQQGGPTIILTTCSPAESPVRSPLPNVTPSLPTTPPSPDNRMSMPTFNVITATPTHSMGRLSPEREAESIQNNNNIIISATVTVEDAKLQKPSDNFEETCSNTTCPEKPKMM